LHFRVALVRPDPAQAPRRDERPRDRPRPHEGPGGGPRHGHGCLAYLQADREHPRRLHPGDAGGPGAAFRGHRAVSVRRDGPSAADGGAFPDHRLAPLEVPPMSRSRLAVARPSDGGGFATRRLSDETGLLGKGLVVGLVILALLVIAAVDGGAIVITKTNLSDTSQQAAFDGASTYRTTGDVRAADQAAR